MYVVFDCIGSVKLHLVSYQREVDKGKPLSTSR